MTTLEERLQRHNHAFEKILSMIPAKYYYVAETDNQWNNKRQSTEQSRKAKRAKLAPEAELSAKDVHERREKEKAAGQGSQGGPVSVKKSKDAAPSSFTSKPMNGKPNRPGFEGSMRSKPKPKGKHRRR